MAITLRTTRSLVRQSQSDRRLSSSANHSTARGSPSQSATSTACPCEETYLLGGVKSDDVMIKCHDVLVTSYVNGNHVVQHKLVRPSSSFRSVSLSLVSSFRTAIQPCPPSSSPPSSPSPSSPSLTTQPCPASSTFPSSLAMAAMASSIISSLKTSMSSSVDDSAASVTALFGGGGGESVVDEEEGVVVGERRGLVWEGRRIGASWWKASGEATPSSMLTTESLGIELEDDKTSSIISNHHDCIKSGCQRLKINVSGRMFEIRLGVLDRHPTTLLGDHRRRTEYYDQQRHELFFDRHRPSFEAIFSYYQHGGRLKRPYHVPNDVFLDEILFYELEEDVVEEYKRSEGYIYEETPLPSNNTLRRLWMLFEHPETSRAAFVIAILSVIMTLVSIVLFCVETLPTFAQSHCKSNEVPNFADPFFVIESTCTAWFTVEAIIRFVACPNKYEFWKDFKNIVDVAAIIPYYVTLFNVLSTMSCESAKSSASLSFLRVIRLIRVFKLTKHSVGLQVLLLTFRASVEGLGLFLVALVVSILVFSSAIYYAEQGVKDSHMESIPDAFWWAIITMTTVGYGDKVPKGELGRIIGAACAITGVLTLAIPIPIITGNFNRFYSHKTGRGRHI